MPILIARTLYIWRSSEGLGKRKHGICAPIRASMKFSRRGIGCTYTSAPEEAFWSVIYETAISQIGNLESSDLVKDPEKTSPSPGLRRTARTETTGQVSSSETHSPAKTILKIPRINFQRQSVLNGGIETSLSDTSVSPTPSSPAVTNLAGNCSGSSEEGVKQATEREPIRQKSESSKSLYKQSIFSLSESSLLKLGTGRTGHPAARFGLRCGGKLSRAAKFL
ncbi:unnamed protein product [Schistocephalus solidus]|uniref:G-patch domain-containing protein n=1 Tax=Schistocephalus solidus TaxID=70667 RepID=A0A183SQ67_SCHSO|nr:unnamed protein product [Schistocephalus solidus]